ncbi:hypothetical protein BH09ACT1_BH09ACT1_14840 [soil metagenome]
MKYFALLTAVTTAMVTLIFPFIDSGNITGSGEAFTSHALVASSSRASTATSVVSIAALERKQAETAAYLSTDSEHMGQKPVPVPVVVAPPAAAAAGSAAHRSSGTAAATAATGTTQARQAAAAAAGVSCPAAGGGGGSAPGVTSAGGVGGTTTGDIQSFSATFNTIRAANCLAPIAAGNFRYDSCMEQRLFWIAEDPSTDPNSAWGHIGSVRSDGVPSVGCDGNLAGGSGNSGATVAQKWWDSLSHRAALYRPTVASTAGVCIYFAMVHGGIPNDPASFTRAAARWGSC